MRISYFCRHSLANNVGKLYRDLLIDTRAAHTSRDYSYPNKVYLTMRVNAFRASINYVYSSLAPGPHLPQVANLPHMRLANFNVDTQ